MDLLLNSQEILDLGRGQRGVRIVCKEGSCWLTQSGDDRDHILGAGDSFIVRGRGRLIITATEPCRLLLLQSDPHGRQAGPLATSNWVLKNFAIGGSP